MTNDVLDFAVFIVDKSAIRFFDGDATESYKQLKNAGILDYYKEAYDVSHTLGEQYLLNEIEEMLKTAKTNKEKNNDE